MTEAAEGQQSAEGQVSQQEGQQATEGQQSAEGESEGSERWLSQADADKIIGRRVKEDRDTRAKEAGFESWEEMSKAALDQRKQVEAQKTEAQKAQEAAEQHQQRVQELEQELAARDYEQQVGGAMRKHGLVDDYSDDALLAFDVYATANDLYDSEGNLEDPEAAVQQFAESKPIYFGGSTGSSAPDMNSGGGGGSEASLDAFEQRLRQQGLAAG